MSRKPVQRVAKQTGKGGGGWEGREKSVQRFAPSTLNLIKSLARRLRWNKAQVMASRVDSGIHRQVNSSRVAL